MIPVNGVCHAPRGRRWTGVLTGLLLGLMIGCSSAEPPETTTQTESPDRSEAPADDATPPQPAPAMDTPSPQEQAARTAFRTMTLPDITTQEWEAAHQQLQEIGTPALPVLVEGLTSTETVQREMASTVLALFGQQAEPQAEVLIAALDDQSHFVRANVAAALLQMPDHVDRVVPVLAEFLKSDDADLRRMAATNLAAVEVDQARPLMPQLIVALADDDREVVYYAAQLLGRMGPDAAAALPQLKALDTTDDAGLKSTVDTAVLLIEPDNAAAPPAAE